MRRDAEQDKDDKKTALRGQIVYTDEAGKRKTLIMFDKDGNVGGVDGKVDLTTYAARYSDGKRDDAAAAASEMSSLVNKQLPGLAKLPKQDRTITKVAKLGDGTQVFQVDIGTLTDVQEKAFFGAGAELGGPLLDKAIVSQSLEGGAVSALNTTGGVLYGTRLREEIDEGKISENDVMDAAEGNYASQVELMRHLQSFKGQQYQLFKNGPDGIAYPAGPRAAAPALTNSLVDKMKNLEAEGAKIDLFLKAVGVNKKALQSNVHSVDAIGSPEALKSLVGYSYATIANTVADRETARAAEGDMVDKRTAEYTVKYQRTKDTKGLPTPEQFRQKVKDLEAHKDEFLADQRAHLPLENVPGRSTEEYNQQKENVKKWVREESLRQIQLAAEKNMEVNGLQVFRKNGATEAFIDDLVKKTSKSSVVGALNAADSMPDMGGNGHNIFDILNIGGMAKAVLNAYAETVSSFKGVNGLDKDSTPADVACYRTVSDPKFANAIVEGVEGSIVTHEDGTRELDLSGLSLRAQRDLKQENSKTMELLVGMVGFAKATYGIDAKISEHLPESIKSKMESEGKKYAEKLEHSRAQLEKDPNFKSVNPPEVGTANQRIGSSVRPGAPGSTAVPAARSVFASPAAGGGAATISLAAGAPPPAAGGSSPPHPHPGSAGPRRH